ncbi:MAG: GNAT family N-acetyltransferase [Muribaculaceae bacterium]|nr:GNAT family N-acetyltransferase [Muribaculaceae bacterium]
MMVIKKYDSRLHDEWNQLVEKSRNGTFLLLREYMDYHSDRFTDHSLMAYDEGRLIAVMPANSEGPTLFSHKGLTYGGWVMPAKRADAPVMLDVMEQMVQYLRTHGFKRLIYKAIPHIYHQYPAEEDIYALWRQGAKLVECDISTTIDLRCPLPLNRGSRSAVNAALRSGITVARSEDLDGYWQLLSAVLKERHNTVPVHTAAEMRLLQSRFPSNIKLYTASLSGELLAGVLMYISGTVAHCQYIAASPRGREAKALTLLFDRLISLMAQEGLRYFDFGTSNEQHGLYLNRTLAQQKTRLGGRGVAAQIFELDVADLP